jgi:ADP-heptose:LPS heptosyltransferase
MKILQILPKMNLGGVERGVLDLAYHFGDRMVVISGGGNLTRELEKTGAIHYRLPVYRKSLVSLFLIKRVREIIKRENIKIVHARSRVPAWISFFATRGLDVNFITTAHGAYTPHLFSKVMGWGKFVICPSQVIARHMIDKLDVDEEKIRIISRWVDLERFKFKEPKQRRNFNSIISIGRISPSKGFEYLIQALRKVVRVNPYVTLNIVGEPDPSKLKYLVYLKSLVSRFSLNYSVNFLGYRRDIENLLAKSSVLVCSSVVEEAFGRVVIEAFSCGVPVIATKVGAMEEIITHKEDGILVFPKDPSGLGEAILEVLNNVSLAQKLAINARRKVERLYSFCKCISKIEEVYRQAEEFKRILVIKLSSLGDVVLSIPSLKALKENFSSSQLTLLTLKKYAPLFYDCPYVDKVIGIDTNYKKVKMILSLAQRLRSRSFDYIIDLQNNLASHLIAFLSFPKKSFGYNRKLGKLLTSHLAFLRGRISPLDSQEKILNLLGIKLIRKELTLWRIGRVSLEYLGVPDKDNLIGINVSASRKWKSKNWPLSHTVKLIEMVKGAFPDFQIVLIGDAESAPLASRLQSMLKSRVINLCGRTTLKDLLNILGRLKIFITQDTASLHLAQALGVETIALFGPTDPVRHTVKSKNLHLFFKKLPCSFCYNPRCKSNICMSEIKPQEVFAKVKTILKSSI